MAQSLEELDPKHHTNLLPKHEHGITPTLIPNPIGYNGVRWTIDGLLTSDECDLIVSNAQFSSFQPGHERCLAFDQSLVELIESRLERVSFWERFIASLEPYDVNPPALDKTQYTFCPNLRCNTCVRIHRYAPNSAGFKRHRDSPYVESRAVRSNYTLLIFLTNDDGYTQFFTRRFSDDGFNQNGSVLSSKGSAVVFSHKEWHSGVVGCKTKVVLRTDLISHMATAIDPGPPHMRNVSATRWFRIAQLYELQGHEDKADEWYERVLDARFNTCRYENILAWNKEAIAIIFPHDMPGLVLRFVERTPTSSRFLVGPGVTVHPNLIRSAIWFAAITECCKFDAMVWRKHMHDAIRAYNLDYSEPVVDDPGMVSVAPSTCELAMLVRRLDGYEPGLLLLVAQHVSLAMHTALKKQQDLETHWFHKNLGDKAVSSKRPVCVSTDADCDTGRRGLVVELEKRMELVQYSHKRRCQDYDWTIWPRVEHGGPRLTLSVDTWDWWGDCECCMDGPGYGGKYCRLKGPAVPTVDPFVIELVPTSKNEGRAYMTGPFTRFNHAGCHCSRPQEWSKATTEISVSIRKVEYWFGTNELGETEILILYEPMVFL